MVDYYRPKLPKRVKFNGKWYTKKSGHFHKELAEKASSDLGKKGWLTKIVKRKSYYSGLEIFDVYIRGKTTNVVIK